MLKFYNDVKLPDEIYPWPSKSTHADALQFVTNLTNSHIWEIILLKSY